VCFAFLHFAADHAMEFASPDVQSKEKVAGAEGNGDDENSASVGPAAGFDSGSMSSVENLPALSDSKVILICLCRLIILCAL